MNFYPSPFLYYKALWHVWQLLFNAHSNTESTLKKQVQLEFFIAICYNMYERSVLQCKRLPAKSFLHGLTLWLSCVKLRLRELPGNQNAFRKQNTVRAEITKRNTKSIVFRVAT